MPRKRARLRLHGGRWTLAWTFAQTLSMADSQPPPPQRFRWDWGEFAFATMTNEVGGVSIRARAAVTASG